MTQDERIKALECRLQTVEDHLEILNLLNCYGPLVDCGAAQAAAELWMQGGGYNYSGGKSNGTRLEAPDDLIKIYEGPGHVGLISAGCSHLTATPIITISGNTANALGYTYVILKEGDRWFVFRAAINEWKLLRTDSGWRIAERFNRTIDGSEESQEVMRRILSNRTSQHEHQIAND